MIKTGLTLLTLLINLYEVEVSFPAYSVTLFHMSLKFDPSYTNRDINCIECIQPRKIFGPKKDKRKYKCQIPHGRKIHNFTTPILLEVGWG